MISIVMEERWPLFVLAAAEWSSATMHVFPDMPCIK